MTYNDIMITIIFYILAAMTLGSAVMTVVSRNPVNSAVFMIVCFFTIAGHMLMLDAQFLALVQILVYSGAIMVLVLFTLMLMNLKEEHEPRKKIISRVAAVVSAGLAMLVMLAVLVRADGAMQEACSAGVDFTSAKVIGEVLMNEYLLPFEFVSILLITAMIGAVLISKREKNA